MISLTDLQAAGVLFGLLLVVLGLDHWATVYRARRHRRDVVMPAGLRRRQLDRLCESEDLR